MHRCTTWLLAPSLVLAMSSTPTFAGDGVLEINQTCAVQTGCFPGDTPGFPVTIDGDAGSSYRLSGDLNVPDVSTTAILLASSGLSVDLNGFSIIGPVFCSGIPLVCTPSLGTGDGVARQSPSFIGIRVHNGTIRGMGRDGINLADQSLVDSVHVTSNGRHGINVGFSSIVRNSVANRNGDNGVDAQTGSVVHECSASFSGGVGFRLPGAVIARGNNAYYNNDDGFAIGPGGMAESNVANLNLGFGLNLSSSASFVSNNVRSLPGSSTGTVVGGLDRGGNTCDAGACP